MDYQNFDPKAQGSWFVQNLRKVVGWSYLVADAAMAGRALSIAKGTKQEIQGLSPDSKEYKDLQKARSAKFDEVKGMALWSAGGVAMAAFGNRSAEKELAALEDKLYVYLQDNGVEIGEGRLARALKERNKGVLKKLEDFAYQYPAEIMHGAFVLGSVGLLRSGINDFTNGKGFGTLGMGICCLAGSLIGVLVKEKSPEELSKLEPAKNFGDKASRWLQAHANKATAALYFSNNLFSIESIREDYNLYRNKSHKTFDKERAKSPIFSNLYKWRVGAVSTYVFGAGVLQATSKSSGAGGEAVDNAKQHLMDEMADIIRQQPQEQRQLIIGQVSEYLSQRRELGMAQMDAKSIAAKLHESLGNTPASWVARSQPSSPEGERNLS